MRDRSLKNETTVRATSFRRPCPSRQKVPTAALVASGAPPTGKRQISFGTNRDGNYEIYTMDEDGASQRRLTNTLATELGPAWSPDGRRIAFVGEGDNFGSAVFVMNADGTNLARLTNSAAHEAQPAWQPSAAAVTTPVLLAETGTNCAVALDSVTFVLDPFTVVSPANLLAADRRTRVALFAANVAQPVAAADISAQAEDSAGRRIQLPVEYVGRVNGFDWLTQVVVRLPDDAATAEHLWIGLNVRGTPTNKAVVTMKTSKQ